MKPLLALVLTGSLLPAGSAVTAGWTVVPTPDPANSWTSRLTAVEALTGGDAWAVGYAEYGTAPSIRPSTARWTGSAWVAVPTPVPAADTRLDGVDAGGGQLWAVGSAGAAAWTLRWTGTAWTAVSAPGPVGASAVRLHDVKVFGAADAWAVGEAALPAGTTRTHIVRWTGADWAIVPSPSPDPGQNLLSAVDGAAADDVWAVGGLGFDGYGSRPVAGLILHWNGTSWTRSTIPDHPTLRVFELRDVVVRSAGDVWAVGIGFSFQRFSQVPVALHWNGQAWQHVAGPAGDTFSGVSATATSVYAVGNAGSRPLIAQWNGTGWTTSALTPAGWLAATAASGAGPVWAVGAQAASSGGAYRTLAAGTG